LLCPKYAYLFLGQHSYTYTREAAMSELNQKVCKWISSWIGRKFSYRTSYILNYTAKWLYLCFISVPKKTNYRN